MTFVNTEDFDGPRAHNANIAGGLTFTGSSFELQPGDAYFVVMSKTYSPTLFLPDVS